MGEGAEAGEAGANLLAGEVKDADIPAALPISWLRNQPLRHFGMEPPSVHSCQKAARSTSLKEIGVVSIQPWVPSGNLT